MYYKDSDILRRMWKMLDLTVHCASTASVNRAYWVARALHKARAIDFQKIVKHVGGIEELVADYNSEMLQHILNLDRYYEIVEGVNAEARLGLALLYKWMPSPDFDATSALGVMKAYHENPRKCGFDANADKVSRAVATSVTTERKMNLIYAYQDMYKAWPPGLVVKGRYVTKDEALAWDHTGCLAYVTYGKDITVTVKDKTCAPASLEVYMTRKGKTADESYLLWYMKNKENIDTNEMAEQYEYSNMGEDNYVSVAYKPESHKVDSRLFYIAPPKQRVLLSELEVNLSKVDAHYPGSLMGVEATKKRMIIDKLMDTRHEAPNPNPSLSYTIYTITLDLSKFSARASYTMTENYHTFWSEVYAVPHIRDLARMGCKGVVAHNKFGLKMSYVNNGADLEGFRGRLMTMLHVDVLAAATRRARNENVITGKAVLGAFIDDGGFKVNVIGEGEEASNNLSKLLNILSETYASVGQEMQPTKATVSKVGGDLLSEPYLNGVRVPTPIKSAQRLYPSYENAATALTEEFDSLFAASQGAVKEGCKWGIAYVMYVESVVKAICRWSRGKIWRTNTDKLALNMITPKSFGGFGLQPVSGLVSTNTTNMTAEGLGMLNRVRRQIPTYRLLVNNVLRKPIVVRPPLAILRDPLRIRAETPVLVENRLLMKTLKWLETHGGPYASFCEGLVSGSAVEHATRLAEAIMTKSSVSVPLLVHVWRSTPLSYIESILGKFKRSETVITLLGEITVAKVRHANKADLLRILETLI